MALPQTTWCQPRYALPAFFFSALSGPIPNRRHPRPGSWFTLERWIAEDPFRGAKPGTASDLDVARGADAKHTLETHWDSWIMEADWKWLSEHGYNTVRIPVSAFLLFQHSVHGLTRSCRLATIMYVEHNEQSSTARISQTILRFSREHGPGSSGPSRQRSDLGLVC